MFKYVVEVNGRKLLVNVAEKKKVIEETFNEMKKRNIVIPPHEEVILHCFCNDPQIQDFYEVDQSDLPDKGRLSLSFIEPVPQHYTSQGKSSTEAPDVLERCLPTSATLLKGCGAESSCHDENTFEGLNGLNLEIILKTPTSQEIVNTEENNSSLQEPLAFNHWLFPNYDYTDHFLWMNDANDIQRNRKSVNYRKQQKDLKYNYLKVDHEHVHESVPVTLNDMQVNADDYQEQHIQEHLPWPDDFEISENNFSQPLKEALAAKAKLKRNLQTSLLDCIYDQFKSYSYYPTRSQYGDITRALLRKYPYLKGNAKTSQALELWRLKLSQRVRNIRRYKDRNAPVCVQKRKKLTLMKLQKRLLKDEGNSSASNYPIASWMQNYTAPMKSFSDEYIKNMQTEVQKEEPNHQLIATCLYLTLERRRNLIVNENPSMKTLKEIYPGLFSEDEIICEFFRLTSIDLSSKIKEGMALCTPALLSLVEQSTTPALSKKHMSDERERAMLSLPTLLEETTPFSGTAGDIDKESPHLSFDSDTVRSETGGQLMVRNEAVCRFSSVFKGICVWVSANYIFNCAYPRAWKCTLMFFLRVILHMKDEAEVPIKLVTLIQHLPRETCDSWCIK